MVGREIIMPKINELSAMDSMDAGDNIPVFDVSNGDARKASMSLLTEYFQSVLTHPVFITQYNAPSSTGFSVQITDGDDSIHLILTPVATYADGEIVLPAVANAVDKQEILINCTQIVTTLVVDGNGATVTGEPSALTANGFFRLKYDLVTQTWYRVG